LEPRRRSGRRAAVRGDLRRRLANAATIASGGAWRRPISEALAGGCMLDLRVVGGTLVTPGGRVEADLGIVGGRIAGQYQRGDAPDARQTVDAADLLVLPGVVDAHFHCRAPGHPEREDFTTGTRAAAAGGATTVLEMPLADPG